MPSREKEYLLFPTERDLRLDLFRGIGQWMVFLDHIPFDVVNWLTVRNYGFSDAAEMFVFISGYTAGFVYGQAIREGRIFAATARLLKRVWQLYVAHVFLFVFFIAYIAQAAEHYDNPMLANEYNIFNFLRHPDVMLMQGLMLKFKPVDLDVLPLYIVLLLVSPAILWAVVRVCSGRPFFTCCHVSSAGTCPHSRPGHGTSIRLPGRSCSYSACGVRSAVPKNSRRSSALAARWRWRWVTSSLRSCS